MFAVPVATVDTIPVNDPTVATEVFPDVQAPPAPPKLTNWEVAPRQMEAFPVIDGGVAATVTGIVLKHPGISV